MDVHEPFLCHVQLKKGMIMLFHVPLPVRRKIIRVTDPDDRDIHQIGLNRGFVHIDHLFFSHLPVFAHILSALINIIFDRDGNFILPYEQQQRQGDFILKMYKSDILSVDNDILLSCTTILFTAFFLYYISHKAHL